MELAGLRMEIDEKIVVVAGVSVPEAEQPFDSPKAVERIQVDQLADHLFVIDLTAFAGQTITLEFFFDTVDDTVNETEGVLIDNITIYENCD